jgi:hypothetical protein
MRSWLRRLFIVLTIGGGFVGLLLGVPTLLHAARTDSHYFIEAAVFGPLYAYAIYLGLRLCDGRTPIWGLVGYFALQIPWIDCPGFSYRFYTGALLGLVLSDDGYRWAAAIGWLQQFRIASAAPVMVGVNIVALLLVLVLITPHLIREANAVEGSNQSLQPTAGRSEE